jgi:hypothetical protein
MCIEAANLFYLSHVSQTLKCTGDQLSAHDHAGDADHLRFRYTVFMNRISEAPSPPKLTTLVREQIRYQRYALLRENAYRHWVRAFIRFHDLEHPADMGRAEVEPFLSNLANARQVSACASFKAMACMTCMPLKF